MVLVIDNYDSCTYNLVQYLGELGADVNVMRNDVVTLEDVAAARPDRIVISPGPGRPEQAGVTMSVIRELGQSTPIFGVCLGHQAIGAVFGGSVVRATVPMHGKTSTIEHDGRGLFTGISGPFVASRYHSLVVADESLPSDLVVSARTKDDAIIMGLRHRLWPVHGVQVSKRYDDLFDTCGTGGDRSGTFNISSCAALVVAACGVHVAKHGNRSASSRTGGADVYEALGVRVTAPPAVVERCLAEAGIGFFFAPTFHPSMRHAGPVRRELGVRTAFNLLGPLTNPAGATRQLVGVPRPEFTELLARSLMLLGTTRAWVVHGADGIDELTTTGYTKISECRDGAVNTFYLHPADVGLPKAPAGSLQGGDAYQNARTIEAILDGTRGPARDVVRHPSRRLRSGGDRCGIRGGWRRGHLGPDGADLFRRRPGAPRCRPRRRRRSGSSKGLHRFGIPAARSEGGRRRRGAADCVGAASRRAEGAARSRGAHGPRRARRSPRCDGAGDCARRRRPDRRREQPQPADARRRCPRVRRIDRRHAG